MCWSDLREDASSVGRCIGNTACNHLSLYQEMAYCTWSGESKTKTTPKSKKPKPQGSRENHDLYKPLYTHIQRPPYIICCYCINMLHNSYTVSRIHKHILTIFLRADHTTGAANMFSGTLLALPASPFTALKGGERRGARKPPVCLHVERVCPGFLDRQSSQDCRFPFPAPRLWSWLFFFICCCCAPM